MNTALIVSFIVGVLGSLAAAFLFPSLQTGVTAALIRIIGWLPIRRQASFDGVWKATWHVESPKYPSQVTDDNVKLRQLGNRIYAKFRAEKLACYLMGTIEDRYITGTWYDEVRGGYHGAFQLIADIRDRNHLSGLWIGYSTSGIVKSGVWEWERKS